MINQKVTGWILLAAILVLPSSLQAQKNLEIMSLERWAKLREV